MKKANLIAVVVTILLATLVANCGAPTAAPTPTAPPVAEATATGVIAAETATSPYEGRVFKMASMQPLTGDFAWFGWAMGSGARYAVDEINASGELPFQVQLIEVDHKSGDPVAGAAGIRKVIDVDKVQFIAATWGNIVPLVQAAAAEAHIPVMNGGALNPDLANLPYLWNNRLMMDQESIPLIEYLVEEYGMERPAMIFWNDPGGCQLGDSVYWQAEQLGITVVAKETHEPGITDYRALLARIKAANPDVLLVYSHGADIGYIVKQAHEIGINVPMATIAEIPPDAIEVAGCEELEGMLLSAENFDLTNPRPEVQAFIEGFTEKEGEPPNSMTANYYDITYVMFDAIQYLMEQGRDPFNTEELAAAIGEKKVFRSLYGDGEMELRSDGTVIKPGAIFKFYDCKDNLVEPYTPDPSQSYEAKSCG